MRYFNVKGHKNATHYLNSIYFVKLLDQMSSKSSEYKKPYTPGTSKNPVCGVDSVVDIKIRGFRQVQSMITCENLQTVIGYWKTN